MSILFLRVTKARQWKRPVRDPISTQQSNNNNNNEEEDGEDTNALPVGWKELIDKKTGRAYYVNRRDKKMPFCFILLYEWPFCFIHVIFCQSECLNLQIRCIPSSSNFDILLPSSFLQRDQGEAMAPTDQRARQIPEVSGLPH